VEAITEFVDSPEPTQNLDFLKQETDPAKRAAMLEPDITDVMLGFDEFKMILGTAHTVGNAENEPIAKQWLQSGTRRFLSERVETKALAPMLRQLKAGTIIGQAIAWRLSAR
jgi:hypothetical protein